MYLLYRLAHTNHILRIQAQFEEFSLDNHLNMAEAESEKFGLVQAL